MLNEFAWNKEEDGETYRDGESLDCKIGVTPEGKFMIQDHQDPSKSQIFDSSEELGEALAHTLTERANR